jgi:hypothetical protein
MEASISDQNHIHRIRNTILSVLEFITDFAAVEVLGGNNRLLTRLVIWRRPHA